MVDKVLKQEQGLTFDIFKENENAVIEGEDGEQ